VDQQNFDPFSVAAWSQVQHAVSEEPQAGRAGQESFGRHLAEASQADPAPIASGVPDRDHYPHLAERTSGAGGCQDARAMLPRRPSWAEFSRSFRGRMINTPGARSSLLIQSCVLQRSFGECWSISMIKSSYRQSPSRQRSFSDWKRNFRTSFRDSGVINLAPRYPSIQRILLTT